ncbi:hypothetical protein BDV36DRAFT_291998 [Aspergillus pseudocaelatus]|uniref:GPI anchored protein n=1 Tax=Aspergillus pseudocaelatus TaxID=1825620 RepID=A0ABQ6WXR9_9EURO|nr:hypothetical protein BDV36DRAFT_291998 [Aspergillus pseudocaelatus]
MVSNSSIKLLMFLAALVLAAMVPALDVSEDLGNIYDDDHLLGIPTFDEPRALAPRGGFVTVTVTDTVCAPPPPVATTSQSTGTTLSTGTLSSSSTGTLSPSVSTKPSSMSSTAHPTISQSTGKAGTTATTSGSQKSTVAPTSNEAVVQGRMRNVLLVLAMTFVGFLMI